MYKWAQRSAEPFRQAHMNPVNVGEINDYFCMLLLHIKSWLLYIYINNNQLENITLYPTAIKIVNTSALSLPFYTQLPTQHGPWMLNRHLKLNTSKTKFIPPQLLHSISLSSAVFLMSVLNDSSPSLSSFSQRSAQSIGSILKIHPYSDISTTINITLVNSSLADLSLKGNQVFHFGPSYSPGSSYSSWPKI